ncbi:MAG: protein kinase [Nocardioidaceae bacterium]|nr:protein kinase [Nocardioidaceae bacterium]
MTSTTLLDNRYVLGELLGRGGMADVFRGTDQVLERPVAVKVLREVSDDSQRRRFVTEARTLASLNHHGLITLLDAGILGDRPYLVMELVEGETLASRIVQRPLAEDEVAVIGHRLAEALDYAHDLGVVHRDVKPSNVLLAGDRVLLADFGIARLVGETEQHTRTGDAIGSPAYLAPEQVAGEPLTPAVDVYSLGLVLLEALTGTRAYTGSPVEAAIARLSAAPEIPARLGGGWRTLLTRMTDRDPTRRPTAAEVARTLGGEVAASPPASPAYDDLDATGALDLTSVLPPVTGGPVIPTPRGIDPAVPATPPRAPLLPRLRRVVSTHLPVLVAVLAAVLVAASIGIWLAVGSGGTSPRTPSQVDLPSGVPSGLQSPLEDLHRAIEDGGR